MAGRRKGAINGYSVADNGVDKLNRNNNTYQSDGASFRQQKTKTATLAQQQSQPAMAAAQHKLSAGKHQTFADMEVDFMFREPYILSGYRLPNQTWRYYFASVFWLHNETLNVWTHAIGCLCVLLRAAMLIFQLDDGFQDRRSFPVVGFALGCFLSNLLSTTAHLLHSKSPRHHYILYMLDYAGITFYSLGNGIGSMYSCSHPRNFAQMEGFYLPGVVGLCWFAFLACALARLCYKGHVQIERKLIMVSVLTMTAAFIAWPMTGRYVDCFEDAACSLGSLNHITVVFVFFTLDALCYTAHFPERWRPGHFDIWGHGHQWFHIAVMVTQQFQLHALHVDLVQLSRGDHVTIDLPSILLSFLVLGVVKGVSLWCLIPTIDRKLSEDESSKGHHCNKNLKSP
ncbi:membrane progestin receptor beta-like [Littorina saxatilis]|uniref:Uncharacterized protein n=1 Tax=Littorina saxatilis TaxID=31220 RepID=A0AAN9B697_9CAEN